MPEPSPARGSVSGVLRLLGCLMAGGLCALAALVILLPILGRTDGHVSGHRLSCQSNLHQIAIALQLYRHDNGRYPLDTTEAKRGTHSYGTNDTAGDGWGLGALFPDYIPQKRAFSCPNSDVSDMDDPAYNSYDGVDPARRGPDAIKYLRAWKLAGGKPDPSERRQLVWADHPAPDGTVVTWCHLHRHDPGRYGLGWSNRDLIVTLDGHVEWVEAATSGHAWVP